MLVKELIAELQKCDLDNIVLISVKTRDAHYHSASIDRVDTEDNWPLIITDLCDVSTDYGDCH